MRQVILIIISTLCLQLSAQESASDVIDLRDMNSVFTLVSTDFANIGIDYARSSGNVSLKGKTWHVLNAGYTVENSRNVVALYEDKGKNGYIESPTIISKAGIKVTIEYTNAIKESYGGDTHTTKTVSSSKIESENYWFYSKTGKLKLITASINSNFIGYIYSITITPIAYLTATLNEACTDGSRYYGTFSSESAFRVPNDVTVSEIQIENDILTVKSYNVMDVVKANTGVMLSSETAGEHYFVKSSQDGSSVLGDKNNLCPSGTGLTAAKMGQDYPNCQFFRLTMHDETSIGYWWGAENGGPFGIGPGKAFLAVPNASASKIRGFTIDETTGTSGISLLDNEEEVGDKETVPTYNLIGQRLRVGSHGKDMPMKTNYRGIIIKNGKKYLLK